MKTFLVMLVVSLLSSTGVFAQVHDDFSDGSLFNEPSWQGTTEDFVVNPRLQLQLSATQAGTSWISTSFSPAPMTEIAWEFWIKQSFAPSAANFGRVYLLSDQADLTSELNGYYLQLGEAGSGDAVELFRQLGGETVSVCRAKSGGIAGSFEIRIKVVRDAAGSWQLWVDYSGGDAFVMEAEALDDVQLSGAYFGISCNYTTSNASGFYFDDVSIRMSPAADESPPRIDSLNVATSSALRLVFSEALDSASVTPMNFNVQPAFGHPQAVHLDAKYLAVVLTFSNVFENGYHGTLNVKGLRDVAGNEMDPVEMDFRYFVPMPVAFNDVIITEVLADPAPVVNLPGHEFAELFNRSEYPVQLEGWQFSDGVSIGRFPEYLLMPGQYVIVCSSGAFSEYSAIASAVALSNFPTLNNDADRLLLADFSGRVVDSIHYSAAWYHDENKAAGGWTLERIDPEDTCDGPENWTASNDVRGGTPGMQNSVFARKPDNMGPRLISVIAITPTILEITFDERIESAVPAPDKFTITPPLGIHSLAFSPGSRERLALHLADEVLAGQTYLLRVTNVYDCPGNRIQEAFSLASFVLPQRAIESDIVINEILFNPGPMGVDFVEIFNRSNKTIDLKDWVIRNSLSRAKKNSTVISAEHSLIEPNEYRVFVKDARALKDAHVTGREDHFLEVDLPGFNDDEGSAALLDDAGMVVDSMYYNEDMHSPFLRDRAGVSLERISRKGMSGAAANWASAAADANFATPGYANSNLRPDLAILADAVVVEPEILGPGGAYPFAKIHYRFYRAGLVANVKIFDQEGRIIREIAANELLGAEGFFRWNGERDNGSMVRMGYYFVWFEVFDAAGQVKTYKKRVAVY